MQGVVQPKLDKVEPFPIAVVVSRFNENITGALLEGALGRLERLGFSEKSIRVVWVPGAVEIPLAAQRLARTQQYRAIVCLGAVIRGDTDHNDYVCTMVSEGCLKVGLKFDLPVLFGVLTTDTLDQALARCGGEHGNKGAEAVDAACEMVETLKTIH